MNNKLLFGVFVYLIIIIPPPLSSADPNVLFRTGAEYFNWSYRGNPSIRSNAVIEAEPYQLISYNLDLYLRGSKCLSVDYYQPVNAEEKGSFYVNDLKKISASPFLFLSDDQKPYWLRVLLTTEYTRDNREFVTEISTKTTLTYNPLDGDPVQLNSLSPGIQSKARFKMTDISFDVLGGCLKFSPISEGKTPNPFAMFVRSLEFRLGYIESESLQPIGNNVIFSDGSFLDESRLKSRGYTYGFKTRDRGAPGLNASVYYSYGRGDVETYNKSYRVEHNYNFGEIWYNWLYTYRKINLMFTLGYFAEWVEIKKDETQIRRDTMRTTYLKTGVCF
jgi:hypothetical protein